MGYWGTVIESDVRESGGILKELGKDLGEELGVEVGEELEKCGGVGEDYVWGDGGDQGERMKIFTPFRLEGTGLFIV